MIVLDNTIVIVESGDRPVIRVEAARHLAGTCSACYVEDGTIATLVLGTEGASGYRTSAVALCRSCRKRAASVLEAST